MVNRQRCIQGRDIFRYWFIVVINIKPLIANHCNIFCVASICLEDCIVKSDKSHTQLTPITTHHLINQISIDINPKNQLPPIIRITASN